MEGKITLELNAGEAIFALDAIQKSRDNARRIERYLIATSGPADEQAIAELTADVLTRVELRLRNGLYPPEDPRWEARLEEAEMGLA